MTISVSEQSIDKVITHCYFFTAAEGVSGQDLYNLEQSNNNAGPATPQHPSLPLLTFCVLVLENGFTVVGQSACVDPLNYNRDKGRQIAYDNARDQIWQLEGYLLKQRMFDSASNPSATPATG